MINDNNNDNGDRTEISKANQMVDDERANDDQMVKNEAAENDETIGSGVSEGNQAAENETITRMVLFVWYISIVYLAQSKKLNKTCEHIGRLRV